MTWVSVPLASGTIHEVMRAPYGMNLAVMFVAVMVYSVGAPVAVDVCARTEVMLLATANNETKEESMVTIRSILKSGHNDGRKSLSWAGQLLGSGLTY